LLGAVRMDEAVLPLANPISSDMDVMRTALLPGLLDALGRNLRRQHERVRLFETGIVFRQRDSLEEIDRIGAVARGSARPEQWGEQKRPMDFHDLRKDVENLLALRGGTGADVEFTAADRPWLQPGQGAEISIAEQAAGWAGAVHPEILATLEIRGPVYALELDIDVISIREIPNAKNVSRFPSVRRDLAFIVPEGVNYRQIRECVTDIAGDLLAKMIIFDVFSGQNVEKGYKSLAIGLILQDVSCTLTDEVVDPLIKSVVEGLEARLDAYHRG
jgi:phenylalanyl-tRNA synthetase beta chain